MLVFYKYLAIMIGYNIFNILLAKILGTTLYFLFLSL